MRGPTGRPTVDPALDRCPICESPLPAHGPARCLPVPALLGLLGGLAVVAAYFMPWFGTQGLLLSGQFLGLFLGSTTDLRRVMPGASGGPAEVQILRALVLFFPTCGGLAALMALAPWLRPGWTRPLMALLVLLGLLVLGALGGGVTRLPAGASYEVGLWTMGLGGAGMLLGGALGLARHARLAPAPAQAI